MRVCVLCACACMCACEGNISDIVLFPLGATCPQVLCNIRHIATIRLWMAVFTYVYGAYTYVGIILVNVGMPTLVHTLY